MVLIFPHLLRNWKRVPYRPFSTIKSKYPNKLVSLEIVDTDSSRKRNKVYVIL